MKWSKLKSMVSNQFAKSLRDSISLNSTRYGNCSCGHAWITLDGHIIANFCTRAYWNRQVYDQSQSIYIFSNITDQEQKRYRHQWVSYGDMSRQGFYAACWEYVHELNIEQALSSDNIVIQALAVIDKRVGKRRLTKLEEKPMHPLAKKLLRHRITLENCIELSRHTASKGKENEHKNRTKQKS